MFFQNRIKKEIIRIGSLLYKKGYIVAFDGNISVRIKDKVWITPTRKCKGHLKISDLVQVDLKGNILYSRKNNRPSSEIFMHLEIYKHRDDVHAIIHAHPAYCIATTLSGISLMNTDLPEISLILGNVPTAPYALTGTKEMFESIKPFIDHDAILLSHHGSLTMGKNLEEAYYKLEQLEHCAKILCISHQIGKIIPLPEDKKKLFENIIKKNF